MGENMTVYQHHYEVIVEVSDTSNHFAIFLNEEDSAVWLEGKIYDIDDGVWCDSTDDLDARYESLERILVKGLQLLTEEAKVAVKIVGKTDA